MDESGNSIPNLKVSIEGAEATNNDVLLYGYLTNDGLFKPSNYPTPSLDIPGGEYDVFVYGGDKYGDTLHKINVTKEGQYPIVIKLADKYIDKPTVLEVSDSATAIKGTSEKGAEIKATIGSASYSGTADITTGQFSITIPKQKAGTKISVVATDKAKNTSEPTLVTVVDKTAPAKPVVNTVADNVKTITGTAEKGAIITVSIGTTKYSGTVDNTNGTFNVSIPLQKAGTNISVIATDASKNSSKSITVTVK